MTDEGLEARLQALEERFDDLRRRLAESELDDWKARIDHLEVQAHLAQMEADGQLAAARRADAQPLARREEPVRSSRIRRGRRASRTVADGVRTAAKDLGDSLADALKKVTPGH